MGVFRGMLNPSAALSDALTPLQSPTDGGLFCREPLDLEAGPHTIRMQVLLPAHAPGQALEITAKGPDGAVLARVSLDADAPDRLTLADALTLNLDLAEPARVTLEGHASSHAALTHLRHGVHAPVPSYAGHEALFRHQAEPDFEVRPPKSVIFGTTAVCNANCFHCPTNKAYSRTQAKGYMDAALFESIVDQLAGIGFDGGVMFGMFGEPLQDPLIIDRMRYLRRVLPASTIVPSTNAAVYDPEKHREALELVDDVAVHIEGVSSSVYDASMRPLKTGRTFPRAERLIDDRAGRPVHIVTPVHRNNLEEVTELRRQWEERKGMGPTDFTPLMNRAGQSPVFDEIALAPQAVGCGPDILDHLFVDWDGSVLMCCQDFHRKQIIGDLRHQTLRDILNGEPRRRLIRTLNEKRWNAIDICSGCKADNPSTVADLVAHRMKDGDAERTFLPREFSIHGAGVPEGPTIRVSSRSPLIDRILKRAPSRLTVIYGPYKPLYPGRYRVRVDLSNVSADLNGWATLEIVAPNAVILAECAPRVSRGRLPESIGLTVDVPAYVPLEFRLTTRGTAFHFHGVSLVREAA